MLKKLRDKRAKLLREAEAFKGTDGAFADDQARASFDAKMTEIDAVDEQIRQLEEKEKTPPAPDAATAERARILGIQDAVRVAKLDVAFAAELISQDKSLDEARAAIFTKLAEKEKTEQPETRSQLAVGEDARDKWLRGAMNWLLHKGGGVDLVARSEKVDARAYDPGEFRGLTLLDLAKMAIERAGQSVRGLDKMQIVSKAFTLLRDITQGTSDFAVLLENTMHKVLQAAYATQPDTWRKFCAQGTVSDFRAHNRYRLGSFGSLDAVAEHGEFKSKAIPDGEKASITASTKGNIINISRQAIVNDDMGAFSRLLTMLGRAAALSVEVDVYALLAQNAGLGPTMSDALPLFDAGHSNIGSGAALSAASVEADAAVLAAQTDVSGNEYLDLQPAVLLVPRGLRGTALTINEAQYDPDTANKLQKPNIVRGLFRDVVGTPRLAAGTTRRYMFADPNLYPTLEVAFLEGQASPVLETKDGWEVDGAEMKVRFDYGVACVDYRGAVTNAGK